MSDEPVQRGEVPANWQGFVNVEEKQRLIIIEDRVRRKKATLEELQVEKRRIMMRAIRRMRRQTGKE